MASKTTSLAGGLGGLALITAILSPVVYHSGDAPSAVAQISVPAAKTTQNDAPRSPTRDDTGPWYALCNEYATGEYEKELVPASHDSVAEKGYVVHAKPEVLNPDAYEFVEERPANKNHPKREYKVKVDHHNVPDLASCLTDIEPTPTLETLIATIPDPTATHQAIDFDRTIVALQQAAEVRGYAFQRYWLPWRPSKGADGNQQTTQEAEAEQRLREEQPGLLVFRSNKNMKEDWRPPDQRLLIFLVGETPTSGINRVQLSRSISYINELCSGKNPDHCPDTSSFIKIAGPAFSGSLPSTGDVFKQINLQQSALQYLLLSPSATSDALIKSFQDDAKLRTIATLASLDDGYNKTNCRLQDYLQNTMNIRPERIALMREDESGYSSAVATGSSACGPSVTTDKQMSVQFPRDLSSLRSSYEAQQKQLTPADLTGKSGPQFGVPISLREAELNRLDSPPSFAEQQQAAMIDRALQADVLRLRRAKVQAIILLASNPLDKVYLLHYLHQYLPDVRLATIAAEEFLLSSPNLSDLSGTLVADGLPLLPDNVIHVGKEKKEKIFNIDFPNSRSEGVFLAAAALLKPGLPANLGGIGIGKIAALALRSPSLENTATNWPPKMD